MGKDLERSNHPPLPPSGRSGFQRRADAPPSARRSDFRAFRPRPNPQPPLQPGSSGGARNKRGGSP